MPNTTITLLHPAERADKTLSPYSETRAEQHQGVPPCAFSHHVPGDTRTPSAPDAIWIGSGDA